MATVGATRVRVTCGAGLATSVKHLAGQHVYWVIIDYHGWDCWDVLVVPAHHLAKSNGCFHVVTGLHCNCSGHHDCDLYHQALVIHGELFNGWEYLRYWHPH